MRYAPYDKREIALRIKDYVLTKRNYRRFDITSASVAEALGIARSTLIKVMSEEMHTTFAQYLNLCRVHRARHMMVTAKKEIDLEHVAFISGYATKETMIRKYQEQYGDLDDFITKQNKVQ